MKCPYCEKKIDDYERFCPYCEGYLHNDEAAKKKAEEQKLEKKLELEKLELEKLEQENLERQKLAPSLKTTTIKCPTCNMEMTESATFCSRCGRGLYAPYASVTPVHNQEKKVNGMAIAGFVLSLLIPLLGLIFCSIAYKKKVEGLGLATAGLIISVVFLIMRLIIYVPACIAICATVYATV